MDEARLTPAIEVDLFVRMAVNAGGFGTVLRKGDPSRGAILLQIVDRGRHICWLERRLNLSGRYDWEAVGPQQNVDAAALLEWSQKRVRFDEDVWIIELDVPQPERFIVELAAVG